MLSCVVRVAGLVHLVYVSFVEGKMLTRHFNTLWRAQRTANTVRYSIMFSSSSFYVPYTISWIAVAIVERLQPCIVYIDKKCNGLYVRIATECRDYVEKVSIL